MNSPAQIVIAAIDQAPFNMGVSGADWLADPTNIAIAFDDGTVIFENEGFNRYQAHFLLGTHGREAVEQVKQSFRTMFEQHGALLIFGLVPDHRRDVKLIARWAGAKSAGKRATPNGVCELFVLSNLMFFTRAN